MTETAALGWVWSQGQSSRVRVELRLDGEAIANGIADDLREDLARSGIGDGRHAFNLPIGDGFRARLSDIQVIALQDDGGITVLEAPTQRSDSTLVELDQVIRGIDLLIGSQRLLHRNLQAALMQRATPANDQLADIANAQTSLQQGIETIELLAVRLEAQLAARGPSVTQPTTDRKIYLALAVAGSAFLASAAALGHVIISG